MAIIMHFYLSYLPNFASTMYFNMSPLQLKTNLTKINTLYLTWKW